jgi:hypothetical protein
VRRFKKPPIALPPTLVAELNQLRQEADALVHVRNWAKRVERFPDSEMWDELDMILSGGAPFDGPAERERVIEQVEILAPEFGMDDYDCERLVARLRELVKGK